MTFEEWWQFGVAQKWCGQIVCTTHDTVPMSDDEIDDWQAGNDICLHAVRVYESAEQFDAAEIIV